MTGHLRTSPALAGNALLTLGIAFLLIGVTGQAAFIGIGSALLAVGIVLFAKARKSR